MHGDKDLYFPPEHARQLYMAAREPKELWLLPGMGHAESACSPELVDRIAGWVDQPTRDPAPDDPALDDPALDDPALDDSALDDSALDDPALDDPALDDPALDNAALRQRPLRPPPAPPPRTATTRLPPATPNHVPAPPSASPPDRAPVVRVVRGALGSGLRVPVSVSMTQRTCSSWYEVTSTSIQPGTGPAAPGGRPTGGDNGTGEAPAPPPQDGSSPRCKK